MRVLLLMVAACSGPMHADDTAMSPDTMLNCSAPDFVLQVPIAGQHYDPNFVAVADMIPFYANGLPGVVCIDEVPGGAVQPSTTTSSDLDNGLVEMRWTLALQPSTRYTLRFSATECEQQVVFFTSAAP